MIDRVSSGFSCRFTRPQDSRATTAAVNSGESGSGPSAGQISVWGRSPWIEPAELPNVDEVKGFAVVEIESHACVSARDPSRSLRRAYDRTCGGALPGTRRSPVRASDRTRGTCRGARWKLICVPTTALRKSSVSRDSAKRAGPIDASTRNGSARRDPGRIRRPSGFHFGEFGHRSSNRAQEGLDDSVSDSRKILTRFCPATRGAEQNLCWLQVEPSYCRTQGFETTRTKAPAGVGGRQRWR